MKKGIVITEKGRQIVKAAKQEAFECLADIQSATERFKEVVESVSEGSGMSKGDVSKYYKLKFDEKLSSLSKLASVFEFLNEGE